MERHVHPDWGVQGGQSWLHRETYSEDVRSGSRLWCSCRQDYRRDQKASRRKAFRLDQKVVRTDSIISTKPDAEQSHRALFLSHPLTGGLDNSPLLLYSNRYRYRTMAEKADKTAIKRTRRHWRNTKWRNTKKYRCPSCNSVRLSRDGIVRGRQRYRCTKCNHRTIVPKGGKG
jgi:DNA-directed RNA polymerase subunit RPC12/RpoP